MLCGASTHLSRIRRLRSRRRTSGSVSILRGIKRAVSLTRWSSRILGHRAEVWSLVSLEPGCTSSTKNSHILACGDPEFTNAARQSAIKHSSGDSRIHFVESDYRPSNHGRRKVSGLRLQEEGDAEKEGSKRVQRRSAVKATKPTTEATRTESDE